MNDTHITVQVKFLEQYTDRVYSETLEPLSAIADILRIYRLKVLPPPDFKVIEPDGLDCRLDEGSLTFNLAVTRRVKIQPDRLTVEKTT